MRLYHDLDLGYFTAVRGGSAPLRRINFKAGDETTLEVEFFKSGAAYVPATVEEMIFVIKSSYEEDAPALALVPTEDWEADGDSDEAMSGAHWYARAAPAGIIDGLRPSLNSVLEEVLASL